jgi:hypothetical protein
MSSNKKSKSVSAATMVGRPEHCEYFADIALAANQLAFRIDRGEYAATTGVCRSDQTSLVRECERMADIGRMPYPINKAIAEEYIKARRWLDGYPIINGGPPALCEPTFRLYHFAAIMLKMRHAVCLDWSAFRMTTEQRKQFAIICRRKYQE